MVVMQVVEFNDENNYIMARFDKISVLNKIQATGIVPIGGPAVSVPTGMFLLMQP